MAPLVLATAVVLLDDEPFTPKPVLLLVVEPEVLIVLSIEVPFGSPGLVVVLLQPTARLRTRSVENIRMRGVRVRVTVSVSS